MKAFGYIRVSTGDQTENGHSLADQQGRIEAYCRVRDLTLERTYIDPGVSAGKPLATRPEGGKLVAHLTRGDHVVAVKLDRLFRNVLDCMTHVEAWERTGVTLHLLDLDIDTSRHTGKLLLQIMAAVAEMERNLTKERNKSTSDYLRSSGRAYSAPPYGYDVVDGRNVPNPVEQAVLAKIKGMAGEGMLPTHIARVLNGDRVPTKTGRSAWHHYTVQKLLKG